MQLNEENDSFIDSEQRIQLLQWKNQTNICAATCDFQQCGILTSVDSDEPVQPPFKLRNPKWSSVSSFTVMEY